MKWLVLWTLATSAAAVCIRNPDDRLADKTPGDGGFSIQLSDNRVRTYVRDQPYVVSISKSKLHPKFQGFELKVEQTNNGHHRQWDRPLFAGAFILYSEQQSSFQEGMCVNTVRDAAQARARRDFQVMWRAPDISGCVTFTAMVIVDSNTWYANDGKLTLTVCDAAQKDISSSDQECCACSSAKYKMTFEGLWSSETHPKDFPTNLWATHFSDVIGASHRRNFTFWGEGQYASEGLRQLAEWGRVGGLEPELKNQAKQLRSLFVADGLWYPNVTKKTSATFRTDRTRPLLSLVSMFGPSPDWIVGISNMSLCTADCGWIESKQIDLFPYDAGTDNGRTYMSMKEATVPQEKIHRITTTYPEDPKSPFYSMYGGEIPPLARVHLQRESLHTQSCSQEDIAVELPREKDDTELIEDQRLPECQVTDWTDFGPCSVSCGKGIRKRTRKYRMEKKAMMARCKRQLVNKEMCIAEQPLCPGDVAAHPRGFLADPQRSSESDEQRVVDISDFCQTTEWTAWSRCSTTCNLGVTVRNRRFIDSRGRKECPHVKLQERKECMTVQCPEHSRGINMDERCKVSEWGDFSPCTVSCGTGLRYRSRLLLVSDELKDICQGRVELNQQMQCTLQADCSAKMSSNATQKDVCLMPPTEGPCRGFFRRYYFEPYEGKCVPFSFGGCRGNRNNFKTEAECMDVCRAVAEDLAKARREQPTGSKVNCQMSEWSGWGPCSVSCGRGTRSRSRTVIVQAVGGGIPCPSQKHMAKHEQCNLGDCY